MLQTGARMRHHAAMNIAFYAPLKSPDHPVPSGDRLMARQLMAALELAGHDVDLVSTFRAFLPSSDMDDGPRASNAEQDVERIAGLWKASGRPDAFLCYHPYYKAPDLIGPALCRRFDIPYVTIETSYSHRRNIGRWEDAQRHVLDGARLAAANICITGRDHDGLKEAAPQVRLARLFPFIDAAPYLALTPKPEEGRLITVAMMRPGDKLSSYRALAAALGLIRTHDWRLSLIGDGPARPEVETAFAEAGIADRIDFLGEKTADEIARLLSCSSIYLWPGHGEAYGLAYLEAQAAGLPVIAEAVAGVSEAVVDGKTGMLTAPGDIAAYADAIIALTGDDNRRLKLSRNARQMIADRRSIGAAAIALDRILKTATGNRT